MPAVPLLLLVSCPIVPATCVPWPSRSTGSSSFQMKSRGETNARAAAQLRRRGKRHVDHAQRRVERPAGRQPKREARVVANRPRPERHAAVEHGDDDVRTGAGLDVPRALHVDGREVPLIGVERVVRLDIAWLRYRGCAYSTSLRAASAAAAASGSIPAPIVMMSKSAHDERSAEPPATCDSVLFTAALRSAPSLNFTITESGR